MNKVKFPIGCTVEKSERERITKLFKLHNISVAGYVLTCLKKKANELEEKE